MSLSSNGGRPTYDQVLAYLYAASERDPVILRRGSDLRQRAVEDGLIADHRNMEFHDAIREMYRDELLRWGAVYGQRPYDPRISLDPDEFGNVSDIVLTAAGRRDARQIINGIEPTFAMIPFVDAPASPPRPHVDVHAAGIQRALAAEHFDAAIVSSVSLLEAVCREVIGDDPEYAGKPAFKKLVSKAAQLLLEGTQRAEVGSAGARVATAMGGVADHIGKAREAHGRSANDHVDTDRMDAMLLSTTAVAIARFMDALRIERGVPT